MSGPTITLGIESSCDETAVAVVRRTVDGRGEILANLVRAQWETHRAFGGVVPELAARAHVECIDAIAAQALHDAALDWCQIDVVAATAGPGLIGGLLVGLTFAKSIALALDKPLIAVNHLEGHALTVGLTDGLAPPYLLLLVSGGHTQTILVEDVGAYRRIGTTIDDALGEAFDKTAKILGLGFPGGPAVEAAARDGDPTRFSLPRPLSGRTEPHFSFAGLKTAVRREAQKLAPLTCQDIANLTAAFEVAVCETVVDRCHRAFDIAETLAHHQHTPLPLVVAGGVAANQRLRAALDRFAEDRGPRLICPPPALCTDNGAMIAWAGALHFAAGRRDDLDVSARARWPLDSSAETVLGAGKHGAKA